MARKNGGVAGGKVSISGAAASGIWDMIDQQQNKGSGAWPSTTVPATIEYLAQAGGGAGGSGGPYAHYGDGGGGAGGLLQGTLAPVGGIAYTVTVGAGGSAASNGSNTVFNAVTAIGGGKGGNNNSQGPSSGGCGGGASSQFGYLTGAAGTAGQGFAGSNGQEGYSAGGGGGTFEAGGTLVNGNYSGSKSFGGNGTVVTISGTDPQVPSYLRTFGGGGSAGMRDSQGPISGISGGSGWGGGGSASIQPFIDGAAGGANTGGGGGGGHGYNGSAGVGGSGIVIIAFLDTKDTPTVSAGLTYTVDTSGRPGYKVIKFTAGTGTITW